MILVRIEDLLSDRDLAPEKAEELKYFRLILIVGILAYVLFGLIYRIYLPGPIPMTMIQRFVVSGIFGSIFLGTYLSRRVRENLEIVMYLTVSTAFSHLLFFTYTHNYQLNYALSLIVVVIIINFIFRGNLRLGWFNLAVNAAVVTTIYPVNDVPLNKLVYVLGFLFISLGSYVLSRSKYRAQEEYAQLFHDSPVGLVRATTDGEITDYNKEMLSLVGNPDPKRLTGENVFDLLDLDSEQILESGSEEKKVLFPWGSQAWVNCSVKTASDKNYRGGRVIVACRDISHRKEAENRIEYISYHDDLTGLYNRTFFKYKVEELSGKEYYPLCTIFIDVDKLKLVNDAFGHQVGDSLLVKCSEVVTGSCREDDYVFRWGGDEIVVLLLKTDRDGGQNIGDRIRRNASAVQFSPVEISLSLGVATVEKPNRDFNFHNAIKTAEDRMYDEKLEKTVEISTSMLDAIFARLEEKASSVVAHCHRVEEINREFASDQGFEGSNADRLASLGRYHDIGKVSLDRELLNKSKADYTAEDQEEVHRHVNTGYQILKELHGYGEIARSVLFHHERWDGTGYPRGLEGQDIPYGSRLISIVDSYELLTSESDDQLSGEEVSATLSKQAGVKLDPDLTASFLDYIQTRL
ncbi:MAG: diguanylate cyclase domain-containing protein [Candidatus Acetothermia bacterium]